jgi:pimeloyl-ACP methyl ester carboxylesterase
VRRALRCSTVVGMELSEVVLRDGRRVDIALGGDDHGRVVLLQHGLPGSRLTAAHADDAARETGVRLVSLSRPGFGRSSPAAPSLAARGHDAIEVATALGIDRFAVLGTSGGAPAAAATAVVGGDRVTALGIAVGIGPWNELEPSDHPGLAAEREIVATYRRGDTDEALEAYRRLAATWFDDMLGRESDEELMTVFDALVAADEHAVEDGLQDAEDTSWETPQLRARFAQDLREALLTYDGMAIDNLAVGLPWDIDVSTVTQPTYLWFGDRDRLVSDLHAPWWQRQIPHARLTVREGEGHGGAYLAHWREMFEDLTR